MKFRNSNTFLFNLFFFLDNCVHGDSMKPFPNNGTCAELVANRPSRCYNREYREFCCGSCNAKFTGKKGKKTKKTIKIYSKLFYL